MNILTQNSLRLLPMAAADGATNMAIDEVLLAAAVRGAASIRFYTWSEPTLSLGYFQSHEIRQSDPLLAGLAWVRRSSGGGAIVHDRELTYAIALPAGKPWHTAESWLCRFHHLLIESLAELGVPTQAVVCGEEKKFGEVLCFEHHTPADLVIGGAKVGGSAQRRVRGALIQHGSILLRQSKYAPSLPGIFERSGKEIAPTSLAEATLAKLRAATDWHVVESSLTEAELEEMGSIRDNKYGSREWNEKR